MIGSLPTKPANTEPKPTWYVTDEQIAETNKKVEEQLLHEEEELRRRKREMMEAANVVQERHKET